MATGSQLGDFLKEKRQNAGLSQGDVSKKLGYGTPQFISNWERGISSPPINALKKIASLYNISADELFEVLLEETILQITKDLKRRFKEAK